MESASLHQAVRAAGARTRVAALARRRLTLLAAGLVVTALAGCGGAAAPSGSGAGGAGGLSTPSIGAPGATTAQTKTPGGTLTVGVNQDVDSMDANRTSGIVNQLMWFSTHDLLLYEDQQKALVPGLAESWSVSSDGKEYTFKLRKDVKFQNGEPFTAEAVKFMFDRIAAPDNVRALANNYIGASQFYDSTEVVDPYTAKLKMKTANNTLLTRLTRGYFAVNSPKAVQEMGLQEFAKKPVGSGPFIFKEWVPGDRMVADKWPDYAWPSPVWNEKGAAYVDRIVFRIIPENATRVAALETGEIQIAQNIAEQDLARLKNDNRLKFVQAVQQGLSAYLAMNTEKPPTNELAVRQAINHAINRPALVKTVCFDIPTVAKSIFAPSTYGYDPDLPDLYPFSLDKAKALLDGAGWRPGPDGIRVKDGQRLSVVIPAPTVQTGCGVSPAAAMVELVQAQLKDAGIEMKIELLAGPAATEFAIQGKHNLVASGFINEDPDVIRTEYHSSYIGQKSQPTRFRNARFDEVLQKQYETPKGPERLALLKEIQKTWSDNALGVPLYNPQAVWVMRSNIEGVWLGSANYYAMFRYAWINR